MENYFSSSSSSSHFRQMDSRKNNYCNNNNGLLLNSSNNFLNSDDVSSFFLVEATGDSDQVLRFHDSIDNNMASASASSVVDYSPPDDDDAESCSCDSAEYHSCVGDFNNVVNEEELQVDGYDQKLEYGNGGHADVGLGMDYKSCVSVDSTDDQSLTELEKSKLFWEACLAS